MSSMVASALSIYNNLQQSKDKTGFFTQSTTTPVIEPPSPTAAAAAAATTTTNSKSTSRPQKETK